MVDIEAQKIYARCEASILLEGRGSVIIWFDQKGKQSGYVKWLLGSDEDDRMGRSYAGGRYYEFMRFANGQIEMTDCGSTFI